jgi:hypothetical protein
MTPITPDTLENTISLEEAVNFTGKWRNGSSSTKLNYIGFIKGFFINKMDIEQLNLLIPPHGGCRGYLGIDDNTNSIKFLLVPVDSEGRDILSITYGHGHPEDDSDAQSTIFDFTTPCPSQCDEKSPLYGPQ